MGYRKVYYNEMWEIIDKIAALTQEWIEDREAVVASVETLKNSSCIKGEGADNIVAYMEDVHGIVLQLINDLFWDLLERTETYRGGYQEKVDGGQSDHNKIHTTMVRDELEYGGEVSRNIDQMLNLNSEIKWEVNRARNMVQDLVWLDYPSHTDNIESALNYAKEIATNLNDNIESYEQEQASIFDDFDTLLNEIRSIICYQLSVTRVPMASYVKNQWQTMCDVNKLAVAATKIENDIADLEDDYKHSLENTFNREELLKEERAEKVKVIRWIATGVCIVAAVAVTVACPAAGPLALGAVGAATGVLSGVTNELCDQYVEDGFEDGVNWSQVGKHAVIGGVTGFVTGYIGGSFSSGGAGSTIGKGFWQKAGEKYITGLAGDVVEHKISAAWDITEGLVTGDIKDINGVINEIRTEQADLLGDMVTGGVECIIGTAIGEVADDVSDKVIDKLKIDDKLQKEIGKATVKTVVQTIGSPVEHGLSALTNEGLEVITKGEEFKTEDIKKEIKEGFFEDLTKNVVENSADVYVDNKLRNDKSYRDKKFENTMKNKFGDEKFDVVEFENGVTVLKADYDKVMEITSQEGYEGKSARELLGLRSIKGETEVHTVDRNDIKNVNYYTESKTSRFKIK